MFHHQNVKRKSHNNHEVEEDHQAGESGEGEGREGEACVWNLHQQGGVMMQYARINITLTCTLLAQETQEDKEQEFGHLQIQLHT